MITTFALVIISWYGIYPDSPMTSTTVHGFSSEQTCNDAKALASKQKYFGYAYCVPVK